MCIYSNSTRKVVRMNFYYGFNILYTLEMYIYIYILTKTFIPLVRLHFVKCRYGRDNLNWMIETIKII